MVHVVLHLRYDPSEIGNEPAEHPGLVQPHERRARVRANQDLHEQAVRLRVLA